MGKYTFVQHEEAEMETKLEEAAKARAVECIDTFLKGSPDTPADQPIRRRIPKKDWDRISLIQNDILKIRNKVL